MRTRVACRLITAAVWMTYLGLGIATAAAYGYLDVDRLGVGPLASAAVAIACWPAVFLGAGVRI